MVLGAALKKLRRKSFEQVPRFGYILDFYAPRVRWRLTLMAPAMLRVRRRTSFVTPLSQHTESMYCGSRQTT